MILLLDSSLVIQASFSLDRHMTSDMRSTLYIPCAEDLYTPLPSRLSNLLVVPNISGIIVITQSSCILHVLHRYLWRQRLQRKLIISSDVDILHAVPIWVWIWDLNKRRRDIISSVLVMSYCGVDSLPLAPLQNHIVSSHSYLSYFLKAQS